MAPVVDRGDVIAAAHMAGQRAAHHRHAGGVLDHVPDPHHGPLLVRQAATAWHQGFAAARAELGKTFVPDLVKVGPEGYIHGYICVRPPCGEKPGHIKAGDLAVAKDGGVVHRKSGWAVGHVARDEGGLFVAHHANGDRTSHDSRAAALRSVSRKYNRHANAAAPPRSEAAPEPVNADEAAAAPEDGWIFTGLPVNGDHVSHPQYGTGTVVAHDDDHVAVDFDWDLDGKPRQFKLDPGSDTDAYTGPGGFTPSGGWPTGEHEEPAGEGHEETAKRLSAAFRSGEPTVTRPPVEGMQAYTTIETFPNGSKWVHKEYPAGTTYAPAVEKFSQAKAARDLLASQVSDAVGAGAPHIVRTSPREVYMPYVGDATAAVDAPRGALTDAMNTPAGARIGVFDAVTGHSDRHSGNIMITSGGTPVPIDNNDTWEELDEDGFGGLFNGSPFTGHLIEQLAFGQVPISSAELDEIADRVRAAKPAFDQAARELGSLGEDVAGAGGVFPSEMFDQTMGAFTRLRDQVADAENEAAS